MYPAFLLLSSRVMVKARMTTKSLRNGCVFFVVCTVIVRRYRYTSMQAAITRFCPPVERINTDGDKAVRVRPKDSTVSHMYTIALSDVSDVDRHCTELLLVPRDQGMSKRAAFEAFVRTHTHLSVPRFYGLRHFGAPAHESLSDGTAMVAPFVGELNPMQTDAHDAAVSATRAGRGAMIVVKCGGGKTVIALAIAATLGVTAFVFVHKSFLVDQWAERIAAFLPAARVGRVQQHKVDVVEKDIVIAMIQSVAKRDYPADVFDRAGLCIFDECHHMAAPVFYSVLHKTRARHMLSLTATEERSDGLTRLLQYGLGDIVYRWEDDGRGEPVQVTVATYRGGAGDKRRADGNFDLMGMNLNLAADATRTLLLANAVCSLHRQGGRHIIVLSALVDHLHAITASLLSLGVSTDAIGFLIGSTPRKERSRAGQCAIVMATYSMAKEGLDIGTLDTLVLATPTGTVEQAVGRIQRPCATKQPPLVYDMVDERSVFCRCMAAKRERFYRKRGFAVATVACT